MAGDSHGLTGPIAMRNPGLLLDVTLQQGAIFTQEVERLRPAAPAHVALQLGMATSSLIYLGNSPAMHPLASDTRDCLCAA